MNEFVLRGLPLSELNGNPLFTKVDILSKLLSEDKILGVIYLRYKVVLTFRNDVYVEQIKNALLEHFDESRLVLNTDKTLSIINSDDETALRVNSYFVPYRSIITLPEKERYRIYELETILISDYKISLEISNLVEAYISLKEGNWIYSPTNYARLIARSCKPINK